MTVRQLVKVLMILLAVHFTSAQENITDAEIIALMNYKDNATQPNEAGESSRSLLGTIYANEYLLYTRENSTTAQILDSNNRSSILLSSFDPSRQTIVTVHGWHGDVDSDVNPAVRNAYFEVSDVNVIAFDWSRLAATDYITATTGVPEVGRTLGRFLNYLIDVTGASLDNMHLIGFSLGAHVVGNAGRELGGRVARITGLDPAGPLWSLNSNRLKLNDALYVEIIHTNRGIFGTSLNIGHVDFYPNGGAFQPGCTTTGCNHDRSWQLFAASLTNDNLVGRMCGSNIMLLLNSCNGTRLLLGTAALNKNGSNGMYYLRTGSNYPY